MTHKKIPLSFTVFSTEITVKFDNDRMNDKHQYGEADYSRCMIVLSSTHGTETLSEDRVIDTFYHEKVHTILDAMHERDLSANEKFVDIFAKLLRQSDETAVYLQ